MGVFNLLPCYSAQQEEHYVSFTLGVAGGYPLNSLLRVLKQVHTEKNSCGNPQKRKMIHIISCRLHSPNQHYTVVFLNISYQLQAETFFKRGLIPVQAVFPIALSFVLAVSEFKICLSRFNAV